MDKNTAGFFMDILISYEVTILHELKDTICKNLFFCIEN